MRIAQCRSEVDCEEALMSDQDTYGYYWFRHHSDGSTFIACRDEEDGLWFMCGLDAPIEPSSLERNATMLGRVPRFVEGGGSIDQ